MKRIVCLLLCCMITCGLCCGCGETPEEREARITKAVQDKIELLIQENSTDEAVEFFNMMTDKQWSYYRSKDESIEYVELTGTITYIISIPVNIKFHISNNKDTGKDYMSKMEGSIMGEYDSTEFPYNNMTVIE